MSRVRITDGVPGVKRMPNQRGYRDKLGYTVDLVWKGTEQECADQLSGLVFAGGVIDAHISPEEGGYFILTVTYGGTDAGGFPLSGPEAVITTWSREAATNEKSLWNLGPIKDALSLLSPMERAEHRAKIEAYWNGNVTLTALLAFLTRFQSVPGVTDQMLADLDSMMDAFGKGTEAYRVDFFQIRRTQVGPAVDLINDDATINQMWSRATLISQPTMPAVFKTVVPAGYFLQGAAQISQIDTNRWQVVQQWDHSSDYNLWIYGAAI